MMSLNLDLKIYDSKLIMTDYTDEILIFLLTLSILGTVGNSTVAFVYWNKKDKQTSTFFVLVLASSDLMICCVLLPITIYMEKIQFLTENLFFCKLFYFLTTTIVPSSSLLMLALAFDRYFCICMVDKNVMNLARSRAIVMVLLVVALLCGIIPGWNAELKLIVYEYYMENVTDANTNDTLCMISLDKNTIVGYFKNIYDIVYLCSVMVITILYGLIYREIYVRQQLKNKKNGELMYKIVMSKANKTSYSQSFVSNKEFFEMAKTFEENDCFKKRHAEHTIKYFANLRSILFKGIYTHNNKKHGTVSSR